MNNERMVNDGEAPDQHSFPGQKVETLIARSK